MDQTKEHARIYNALDQKIPPWRKWGAYVSERMWGTVREDYSPDGNAWNFISHDEARSKAYRWGEDGIAGWCDQMQEVILSFAFWNGKDPILKERLFGLTPSEGNHGEDCKEYYFYLDGTPTHSYMKYLYKYPQEEFPYKKLADENKKRTEKDREYELVDTGVFEKGNYFDIVIEYAKLSEEDACIRLEVFNRSENEASVHILPQIYFRNRWAWDPNVKQIQSIEEGKGDGGFSCLYADTSNLHPMDWGPIGYSIPSLYLYGETPNELLFTHNDSNNERLYNVKSRTPYVKDAFHRYVVGGEKTSVSPEKKGTKACFYYEDIKIGPAQSRVFYFRLTPSKEKSPLSVVEKTIKERKKEADEFYRAVQREDATEEDKMIQRQAFAGMVWSMQYYSYDVKRWFEGDDPASRPPSSRYMIRNSHWLHMHAHEVISMPDKWEYPWFASWDMAFHSMVLGLIDLPLAKYQLKLFLKSEYQHPNGQVPAYEWGFSDTNPPVQAWALWHLYQKDKEVHGKEDREYLEFCFLKLMNNFGWWVNKVDKLGNNVFEGGFLGLDNVSIIDRSKQMPGGGYFEQSDATGWMGFFSLFMMRIALELAKNHSFFEQLAIVFLEHFINIASAMQVTKCRNIQLWDEEDGFFYDVIIYPDGSNYKLKVRSFVGLIPFYALDFFDEDELEKFPHFSKRLNIFLKINPALADLCITQIPVDGKKRFLFSLMTLQQMKKVLEKVCDSSEFLSSYGLRSLSKAHQNSPVTFEGSTVGYEPGESLEKIKGGNSNWRGPIWFPVNFLFLVALVRLKQAVGRSFKVKLGDMELTLGELEQSLQESLINIFRKNDSGARPVHGDNALFARPDWKDLILFYEHYHGDTGRGLGASHQTGWSGLLANLVSGLRKNDFPK